MPHIGTPPVAGFKTTTKQSFSGDNSTTAFTLNKASSSSTDLEVFVDNIQQEPTTAYSVSGTTLTFTEAPPTGTNNVYVVNRGGDQNGLLPPQDLGTTDYIFGDDISLKSDSAVINFGTDSDVTLTHVADTGLILKNTHTTGNSGIGAILTLQTGDTDMAAGNTHGQIRFQAPDEGTGTDAILEGARIQAAAEGDFSSSSNATKLQFFASASGAVGTDPGTRMELGSDGNVTIKDLDSSDGSSATLTLQSGDTDIAADDILGTIDFQAPDEATGTDAILVAAGIQAVSEGDFSSSSNATALALKTGASETATEKLRISSAGRLGLGTSSPDYLVDIEGAVADDAVTALLRISADDPASSGDHAEMRFSLGNGATDTGIRRGHIDVLSNNGTDARNLILNPSGGNIGVGTTTPSTMLDIVSPTKVRSAIRGTDSTTDNASKTFGILNRHYDTSEEDFVVIQSVSGSSTNVIDIGGGDLIGTHNACSSFRIFTAANQTTTGGTTRFSISGTGLCAAFLSNSDNNYVVNANSTGSAGVTGLHNLYYKADSAVFTGYHYYEKKEPTILYEDEKLYTEGMSIPEGKKVGDVWIEADTLPSGKKFGDVKTQGETFEMGDVIVYDSGKVTKCTKAHATNVVGIYSGHPMPGGRWLSNNKDDIATEEHALEVASVGDSQDWNKTVTHYLTGFKVCNENGAISSGDLLCSASKTGYLMKQDGTAITSETVGKSMDTVSFDSDGNATGVYGFLYCG